MIRLLSRISRMLCQGPQKPFVEVLEKLQAGSLSSQQCKKAWASLMESKEKVTKDRTAFDKEVGQIMPAFLLSFFQRLTRKTKTASESDESKLGIQQARQELAKIIDQSNKVREQGKVKAEQITFKSILEFGKSMLPVESDMRKLSQRIDPQDSFMMGFVNNHRLFVKVLTKFEFKEFGQPKQAFDAKLHERKQGEGSHVEQIIEPGIAYKGNVVRKATVSCGQK